VSPLPVPTGKQHHVVHLASDRHNVVLGTAGTGKSTMAMLRADHLARATTQNNGTVLLVTYNNALVNYLEYLGPEAISNITVRTYGRFARGYLDSMGLMSFNGIAGPHKVNIYVGRAIGHVQQSGLTGSVMSRDVGWFVDELHWISGMGIASEAEYQSAQRIGRQTPLQTGTARSLVWAVRDGYREIRAANGFTNDWYDLASTVRGALATDTRPRMYRHILIDEGQDLTPESIRSLTEAVQAGGSVTFFGDYHQAIYGQGLSWRSSGIQLGNRPVEKFVDNYRNTAQIAKVAIAMSQSPYMDVVDEDLVVPTQPVAAGPMPVLVRCRDAEGEITTVRELALEAGRDQTVAILARTWSEAQRVAGTLPYRKLDGDMSQWDNVAGLYVGAYHSAKGLEFDAVFMPFLNDDRIPYPNVLRSFSEEEACSREARLLYVSVTRARSTLVMTYSGLRTRLLPTTPGLWDEEDLT